MFSHAALRKFSAWALVLGAFALAPAPSFAQENEQKFKDWSARCEKPKGAEHESCFIFQRLVTKKDDGFVPVLHVLVGYITRDGEPGLFATVPLGVSLPPGVQLSVDGDAPVSFGYSHCSNQGCLAALALSDALIAKMKAGNQAVVTFHTGSQKPVSITVSLRGFTAGFNSLRR